MIERWQEITGTVRMRVRHLVLVRGLAWVCAVTIGLLCMVSLLDYVAHLDAPWLRFGLLIAIVAAACSVCWQVLLKPLLVPLTDVDIARVIEYRLSRTDDRLSSAAQFRLSDADPALGSPILQQSTINQADRDIQQLDVDSLFSTKSGRRAVLVATAVLLTTFGLVLAAPTTARTALVRLMLPFADAPWPRTTRLLLLGEDLSPLSTNTLLAATGESLTVYVENELGSLPDDLTLDLRLSNDVEKQERLRTTLLRDQTGVAHSVGIIPLRASRGALHFRVRGGDDDGTGWHTLNGVEAASAAEVTITVTPPDYTARPPHVVHGAGQVSGLVGSRVSIEGTASTPLLRATLHRENHDEQEMVLGNKGQRFRVEFLIEEAGTSFYWLKLTDRHGLSASDPPHYELRGIPDRPPVVYIDHPETDLTVTATAEIALRVVARDEIGLTALRLRHTDADLTALPGDSEELTTPLERQGVSAETVPLPLSGSGAVEETVEFLWQLAPLEPVPGTRLTFWSEAADACDLQGSNPPGQVGASSRRQLFIVSESEKQHELAARQSGILDAINSIHERQSRTHESTSQLRIQAELARLRPTDLDLLKQAELEQRDIHHQLADESTGLAAEVQRIQQELLSNQIDDPDSQRRLSLLEKTLAELSERWFPNIEQSLARARKSAGRLDENEDRPSESEGERQGASDSDSDAVRRQLFDAEQSQSAALRAIAEATALLGGWRQRFHLSTELDSLLADQTQVQQDTHTLGRETLARSASRLTAQQQADLARLSDRQRRLASRLEQLLDPPAGPATEKGMPDARKQLTEELLEAQTWLREQGTAGEMHQAAESLKRNEIAAAASAQEHVMETLRSFGERLHQSPLLDPESLLSEILETREQVETLRKQQETLARSSQQAIGPTADPTREDQLQRLVKQQSELAAEAEDLASRLQRRQHADPSRTADRAARRMREAQKALEQQQADQIATNQQEALDDLDQLANELDVMRQSAEGDLAEQYLQELAENLRALAEQQRALRESTNDLNSRYEERGSWSRTLRRELRDLAEAQAELHQQLQIHADATSELPVVLAALDGAGEAMDRATSQLESDQTGELTLAAQRDAEQRLNAVIEIAAESRSEEQMDAQSRSPESNGRPTSPSGPQLHLTAQLRLLRSMQIDVNRRTADAAEHAESDDEHQIETRKTIAREQSRIAELSRVLLQQVIDSQEPGKAPQGEEEQQ